MSKPTPILLFTPEKLDQKDSPIKQELLSLSLQYMLASIGQEYSQGLTEEGKLIQTIEDFNKFNRIGLIKVLVYPFFVAISNGYSNSLYNLFGPFKSFSFGPASMSIFDRVKNKYPNKNGALNYFSIDPERNPNGIEILNAKLYDGMTIKESFEQVKRCILNEQLDDSTFKFEEVAIHSDQGETKPIFAAIDAGVEAVQKQSNRTFFKISESELLFRANYLQAYKKSVLEKKANVLSYDDIGSQRNFYLKHNTF